ncbi:hypothetical protein Y032_0050g1903 [Ancylostoma ceylanicum]|nr:hypothetical protein Y032_0050g1903 [Ancylostoma ceylanicum]
MAGDKPQEAVMENEDQVRTSSPTSILASSVENVVRSLEEIPVAISKLLDECRTSIRYRVPLETELTSRISSACANLRTLSREQNQSHCCAQEILRTLKCIGIENPEDLRSFLAVTEKDGNLITELCTLLNTDVLQIKSKIEDLQKVVGPRDEDEDMEEPSLLQGRQQGFKDIESGHDQNNFQIANSMKQYRDHMSGIGPRYEPLSKQSAPLRTAGQLCHQGMNEQFLSFFQSMSCADPGIFKGLENENFHEFIRKFKRKYGRVVQDDATLIEILADDHLKGRAKAMFLSIPQYIKDQGFEAVVAELASLLACDSSAARIKALAALRNLKLRPGQEIADFCVVLENLGRKANPQCSIEERSMEYAQILLENVANWPEYVQLIGALHRIDPRQAYNEIKQLAIGIEQSRRLCNGEKGYGNTRAQAPWRDRANAYARKDQQNSKSAGQQTGSPQHWNRTPWRPERSHEPELERVRSTAPEQGRRCYHCSQYGHLAKECPRRQSEDSQHGRNQNQPRNPVSAIINNARNLAVRSIPSKERELVGKRTVVQARLMGKEIPALLDTGSMISIIPIKVLEEAQKRGYDVDALEVLSSNSKGIYDASNNEMTFLGAVRIEVQLQGGSKQAVAFHISKEDDEEILIGTNALENLGVSVMIEGTRLEKTSGTHEDTARVVQRVTIPPYKTAWVRVGCEKSETGEERILWPSRKEVADGVFKITNQEAKVPIFNPSEEAIVLRKNEELGTWVSDKWHDTLDDTNTTMLDSGGLEIEGGVRREELREQIKKNRVTEVIEQDIENVLEEYPDAFAISDKELTQTELVKMEINTGENTPVKLKTRPVPLGIRTKLREMLQDLEKRAIIEKSSSEWAFPIVLVEKKDGSIRLCVDYRELIKRIKLDSYPIPTIEAILQNMAGKRFFSTLDMCSGYWQIPLEESSREKSSFTTPEGLYQFRVVPFGLSTSPAVFQRLMDAVLSDLLGKEVFCYIDDIMICTDTRERHIELLREVCKRMRKAGLKLKAKKCVLLQTSVTFLGHIIDVEGVHTDPAKVDAITKFPVPTNEKELRRFLGMASFYRKFCLGFSKEAGCLFSMTSTKKRWMWGKEQQEAFEKIKKMISSAPVLAQPNIEKARSGERPFIICTDASTTGLGAVLSQKGDDNEVHPIFFASKALSKAERNYHVTDLEALAVVFAVRRFHIFIYGLPTTVYTDHQPLTALFKRTNVSTRVLRWSLELQRYSLNIEYVKGKANAVADALSRGAAATDTTLEGYGEAVVSEITVSTKTTWLKELQQDDEWSTVIEMVKEGKTEEYVRISGMPRPVRVADFGISNGELTMYREDGSEVLIVPRNARRKVFLEAHEGVLAGHFSAQKILNQLRRRVFWPEMAQDIHKWTKECQRCYIENPCRKTVPPLKPIITTRPYEVIGVDILELGPTTSGNRYAVTVIDHFSKYAAAYPVPDKKAETVAKAIFLRWIADGCRWPQAILSDRGGEFENKIMDEIVKITGMKQMFTKGYNPRENGITERMNGTIVTMLRKATKTPLEWDVRLPFCIMAYNMIPHNSTGESPYFILHGTDPVFPSNTIPSVGLTPYQIWNGAVDYKAELTQAIAEAQERVRENNDRMRARMKNAYDKRNDVENMIYPKIGDRVYMKCPTEKAKSSHPKLTCEWAGPFRVLDGKIGNSIIDDEGEE